ncbi:MAG: MMPL family transporter [Lentimicrobium sp.]|jgi:hypothetical protein|nr:MMPL family transporter [Lentimicrobium sp.]
MKTNRISQSKRASIVIISITMLISAYFIYAMSKNSRMETDLDEYMPAEHPAFIFSDQAEEWFNIKDGILIAIENRKGIYNTNTLEKINELTLQLQEMAEFEDNDVVSLSTADNITGSDDGMDVRSFYKEVPDSKTETALLQQQVKSNDMVYGRFVSYDETVGLIVAGMNDSTFNEEFYSRILDFAKSFEDSDNKIYVAGRPVVEGSMALLGPADMKRMVPLVLIVIALVLYLLLKSKRATVATLATVFISTIWAFGLMAVSGVPIYSVSTMMPVMLIAIGVAYGIYFYNHLNRVLLDNPDLNKDEASVLAIKKLWKPLAMAAFTTIIGFISLLTSQVYPIKYFGVFTAAGIFISFLLAVVFLPATVRLFGYRKRQLNKNSKGGLDRLLSKITDKLILKSSLVYVFSAVVVLISIYGLQKVWINSSFLDKFETDSDIVLTDAFINSKFGGTSTLNVILESKDSDTFKKPQNLALIDEMQSETEKLARVGNSFSLADYLKRMNKVMNSDDMNYFSIPESSDMVAQYLLLYEMSGDPENLTKVVNYDYNLTNITFQLKGDDSRTINEALTVIEGFKDRFKENGITVKYAGSGYKALVFTDLILEGQILSLIMSLILVIMLLSIMFRSLKAGIIGSVPILITAVLSFGIMGIFNIPLSTTTALLSSIAIGIGIDYAIHFLEHYRENLKTDGAIKPALMKTMHQTGRSIVYNAVVVIAGFLVLLFSVFPPNRTLGALVSLNMFTSLIGTLTIMMVLVHAFRLFSKK